MFELFTTLESFSAYIIILGCIGVLSIIFESKFIEIEDKIRDFFAGLFSDIAVNNHKNVKRNSKTKVVRTTSKKNDNCSAA